MTFGVPVRGEKGKQTTTAAKLESGMSCIIPGVINFSYAPSPPLFLLGRDLTDDADEKPCTPNRGSARSNIRMSVRDNTEIINTSGYTWPISACGRA
jgi:hypothetical protein